MDKKIGLKELYDRPSTEDTTNLTNKLFLTDK